MKIGDPIYRGAEVRLPVEVIDMIVAHVASSNHLDSQKSLRACCLVSKTWYAASISHLYYRPHLSPRNFDLFARTICPPLKARRARIGIEAMIKHLDLRDIAYESSNSLTSRLINRTKSSLQSFHPPAVTFSVASLAPLSKCVNLALLDMSGDRYSFTLKELLGSIGGLEHLKSLALPKDMLCEKGQAVTGDLQWPENLTLLHAPGAICSWPRSWDTLFRTWPASLTTLRFPDCDNAHESPFSRLEICQKTANFVQHLEIHSPPRHTPRPMAGTLYDILRVFPRLRTVTIPDDMAANTVLGLYGREAAVAAPRHLSLEALTINVTVQPSWTFQSSDQLRVELHLSGLDMLFKPPWLRKLEIRGSFLDLNSEEKQTRLKELSERLRERAKPDQRESSGIFLMKGP
ncbi:F-box domain protein [Cladophialophora carrionii]|uniref:F-box domain protein n=1 Tax=Cladophialophora carrionii TaxID=86049 RepID=A0A1C1D1T1_9EURO|nr:F-box domain protein [Cladophialophora carrionii]